jgi:hypothetical protein
MESEQAHGNQLGKRYRCEVCQVEVLCLTAGQGSFSCHDETMKRIAPGDLPASD